jgi:hypothetical protein
VDFVFFALLSSPYISFGGTSDNRYATTLAWFFLLQ